MQVYTDLDRIVVLGVRVDRDFTRKGEGTSVRVDTGYIIILLSGTVGGPLQSHVHILTHSLKAGYLTLTYTESFDRISSQWHNFV